jgi:hypothetical protein
MKRLIVACSAAAVWTAGAQAAAPTPVTITGCVHAGIEPETYVLLNVDEVIAGHSAPAGAVYWLSTASGLSAHVGHKVEVRGTYSLDRDVPVAVALENGARESAKPAPRALGTAGVFPAAIKPPYRRLQVGRVRMIGEGCAVP